MKVSKIKLTCAYCQQVFERLPCNHRKAIKKSKSNYKPTCSNKCRIEYLNKIRRRDDFSPFRKMFYKTKFTHRKHKRGNLTLEDVFNQWVKQKGICPYTKLKMVLPKTSHDSENYGPKWASIDRIDSNKPYNKDNIQIVCLSINFAKSNFSENEFQQFVREFQSSLSQT